ncbi:MAG TPA: alpha-ketoacid dehydrogenase subunit beta [Chloroflexota bacterium]|nr:alpha-ketoacid dehydrogenase subunit beta [Chloroflexota bacterium]
MPVITYREALNQALREEMLRDETVMLMGEDIGVFDGSFKVTQGLYKDFGERRVKDTPISEDTIVGAAVGAALAGLRPVVEIMTINFSLLATDQIVNHAAKIRYMFGGHATVPIVIRMPGGGGHQLGAQHSQSLEVWYANIPGLVVVAPATAADAKGLLKSAIRDDNPVVFIENEGLYNTKGEVPEEEFLTPLAKAAVQREGHDVSLVSHSRMVLLCLEAAEQLAKEDIDAEVVDLRSLRPLDSATLHASIQKTNHAVLVEEGWGSYGITAETAATIYEAAFDYLDAPLVRISGVEVPMPYAKRMEQACIPTVDQIVAGAKKTLTKAA